MPDTDDDEQVAELGPDEREAGDEGAPGERAAGVDRRAEEWEAGADLTRAEALEVEEEELDDEEEAVARYREQIEQDALAERDRQDTRHRHDVNRAEAEVAEALRLAHADEQARDYYRGHADAERRLARQDYTRAATLDAGAAGQDDPQAAVDHAEADRYRVSARIETSRAAYDDTTADAYGADALDHRRDAAKVERPDQPPAVEAVRNPPLEPPKARKNLRQRRPQKTRALKDFGIGE